MASFNRVILMGNLTRDPEVRYLSSGVAVAKLGLAVNERYKTKTGEWKEAPTFIDIDVWERQAETCAEYLKKGSPVLVEGRLKMDEWETKEGEKRSKLKVTADRVQFLGGKGGPRDDGPGDFPGEDPGPDSQEPPRRAARPAPPREEPRAAPEGPKDEDDLPF
jgi:single-strand DNA-binding protein